MKCAAQEEVTYASPICTQSHFQRTNKRVLEHMTPGAESRTLGWFNRAWILELWHHYASLITEMGVQKTKSEHANAVHCLLTWLIKRNRPSQSMQMIPIADANGGHLTKGIRNENARRVCFLHFSS